MDKVSRAIWEATEKITEFAESPWRWPVLIGIFLLLLVISCVVQYNQIKISSRKFSEGAIDDKTVRLCQKIRRRSIFPRSALIHDLYCCRLGSMHFERHEEELSFANINDIKNVTDEISWRLYLLLAAYLTNRRYLDFANQYREQKTEGQSAADWLKEQQLSYDEDQLKKATEKITNPKVLEILKVLTEDE